MKQVRLSEQIIPAYYRTFHDTKHVHKIFTSGRAGTKSSRGAIKAIWKTVSDDKCAVVVLRKFHNKLGKTVYKEVLRAITRLGLDKRDFKITRSPMQVTYKANGNTIYFTGSDSIDDTKGMIDEEKPIKLVIIDEVNEFFDKGEGEDELVNIEATFVRGNDAEFCMEYYFNPPKNSRDPVMQWTEKMCARSDCIRVHTDYRDVPVSWLGQKLIDSAKEMKRSDLLMYRWLWLGECVGIPDVIYYMFDENKHVRDPEDWSHLSIVGIGIDYGQLNATTYQAFALNVAEKCIQGIDEYYYSGRDTQKQKSPSEYAKDFKAFKESVEKRIGRKVNFVWYDPSARGLAEEIKRVCPDVHLKKADNTVDLGITRCQKLLALGRIYLSPRQRMCAEEMHMYKYDEDSVKKGKEVPVKQNDHAMDAMRYLVMGLWRYLKHLLPNLDDGKDDGMEGEDD